jgi:hypothetical protein
MRLGRRPVVDRRTVPITEQVSARRDEISELQLRFKLLDAQYTNDIKQLIAIEESGQFFVLREPMVSHTLHLGRSTLC